MSTVVGQLEIQMMANMARATADIKKFSRDTSLGMEEVKRGAEMAKGALELIGVGIGVGAFVEHIKSTIEYAHQLENLSQRIGISVKDLTGFKLAADETGTSMESVATAVKKLSVFMVDHNDLMQEAGITATNASEGLMQLSDIFQAMPDGVEKTALAVKLFGRGGLEMIPMMNEGSAKMREQRAEAEALAREYERLAPQAKEFNSNMKEFKLVLDAASVSMASRMMPELIDITKAMAEAAQEGGVLKGLLVGFGGLANEVWAPWKAMFLSFAAGIDQLDAKMAGFMASITTGSFSEGQRKRQLADLKNAQGLYGEISSLGRTDNAPATVKGPVMSAATAHNAAQALLGQADAGKQLKAVRDELLKQSEQWLAGLDKETAALASQIEKERDHIANLGLTKEQQDALAASKIDLEASAKREEAANLAAAAAYAGPLHDAYVQAATDIRAQADQLTELAGLKREAAVKDVALEEQKKLQEQIKKNNEEWKRFTDQIETSLTDALMRGFEGGKNAGKNFIDSLKHTLETAALKIAVQAIVSPIMQGVQGAIGGSPGIGGGVGGGGGGGGGLSLLNALNGGNAAFYSGYQSFATSGFGQSLGLSQTGLYSNLAGQDMASLTSFGSNVQTALPYLGSVVDVAQGNYGSAILSAVGAYFGGPVGAAIGQFVGSSLFGGGGGEDPHNNADSKTIAAKLGMGGAMAPYNYASAFGSAGPTYVVSGQTSGSGRWADHPGLSAQDLSGLNSGVSSLFASGHSIASTLGIDPSVINDASVQSENFASAQDALSQLGDVIATKLVPNIRQFQISGQSLFQTLQTDVAAVKALRDQFDAFKNQLALGDLSTLDPLSKYRMAKDLYNKALTGTDSNAVMQAGQQFLQASRSAFASSASYAADYNNVMSTVTNFENKAVQYPWQAAATTTDTTHAAANVAVSQAGFQGVLGFLGAGGPINASLQQLIAAARMNATNPNLRATG